MIKAGSADRAPSSLLDRLLDGGPRPDPTAATDGARLLRRALRRDIEALLNTRKPWRSIPARFTALKTSVLSYGLSDFAGGTANGPNHQERLRAEIEDAIRRFEPRLTNVEVELVAQPSPLEAVLSFRINALLPIDPVPEPVSFDTTVDTTTSDVDIRAGGEG